MNQHPTAIIAPCAQIHPSVKIGPYTIIEANVAIDADTEIGPHVVISGPTTLGKGNKVDAFARLGGSPQDRHYQNEPTQLIIGDNNSIREYVTVHRGTVKGGSITRIGNQNLIMAYTHIGHDCQLGHHITLASYAALSGHVNVADYANLSGFIAIQQHTRIGAYTMLGAMSGINKDIPPFVIVTGVRDQLRVTGLNKVGLRRAGFDTDTIRRLQTAFVTLFKTPELLLDEALEKAESESNDCPAVAELINFFKKSQHAGVIRKIDKDIA